MVEEVAGGTWLPPDALSASLAEAAAGSRGWRRRRRRAREGTVATAQSRSGSAWTLDAALAVARTRLDGAGRRARTRGEGSLEVVRGDSPSLTRGTTRRQLKGPYGANHNFQRAATGR